MKIVEKNITRYNSKTGFFVEVDRSEGIKDWKSFHIGHKDYPIKCKMIGCEVKDEYVETFVMSSLWEWIAFYIEQVLKDEIFIENIEEAKEVN